MKYSLYKNKIHLKDFDTMSSCSEWLKNIIGKERSLYEGLCKIKNGSWIPKEDSQLFGYDVKEINSDREYFYELVDKIPEDKLEELRITLLKMAIPEVEVTEEELEAIRKGQEQFANGEFTSYSSIEELEKDIMNGYTAEEFMDSMSEMDAEERIKLLDMLYDKHFDKKISKEAMKKANRIIEKYWDVED